MKNKVFNALFVIFLCFSLQAHAQIINCFINGPTSCVMPLTNVTYTGNHDFCSSGCTQYIWTVTGGSFIVGGVPTSCTTIDMVEAPSCIDPFLPSCNVSTSISGCGFIPVTVRWNAGIPTGTLKLTVKEKGTITLSRSRTITVNLMGTINNATQTGFSCSSATYSASVNFASCSPSPIINWNKQNGSSFSFVGSGLTLTDSPNFNDVTYRLDLVGPSGVVMHSITRTFSGRKPTAISGPSTMGTNQASTFPLNGNALSANWTLFSSCANIQFSTTSYADVRTNNCQPNSYMSLNVSGNWQCGTYSASKGIAITQFMGADIITDASDSEDPEVEDRSRVVEQYTPAAFDVSIYPVPVRNGKLNGVVTGKFESGTLRVMDLTGREMFNSVVSGDNFQIDLPQMQPGIYLVQVQSENGIATQKISLVE
jgi:hypothetical protein